MLCVEDVLDALAWAQASGGAPGLERRTRANAAALDRWVERTPWIDYLAVDPATRSPTSVCLRLAASAAAGVPTPRQAAWFQRLTATLEHEGVAFDIGSYRDAPPGLRIWCGATVDAEDVVALTQWLDWAYATVGTPAG
jgi:phosphoserine aminotransferase